MYHNGSKKFDTTANGVNIHDSELGFAEGHGTASPGTAIIFAPYGAGTNIGGGEMQFYGGRSTGTAAGGSIKFYTSPTGSSGSSANAHIQALSIDSSQNATFAGGVIIAGGEDRITAEGNSMYLGGGNGSTTLVQFSGDAIPDSDSSKDLGSTNRYWRHAYIDAMTTTGDVTIGGDLIVTGTNTIVNVEDLNVEQNEITLNYGTGDTSATSNGAGIRIQDAAGASTDAVISWDYADGEFDFSHPINVPGVDYKIATFGTDNHHQYRMTGNSDHTLALTCGSYYQAEIIITAHQTNGGANNNLYIRGIWSNNHESHHWDEMESIGGLTGSSFDITVSANTTSNSGKLLIEHDYVSGTFAGLEVRVKEYFGTHGYTIS